jgi:hypothetical protein
MLTVCLITAGDLAILLGGYRYHTGDQPGHVVRHGYRDETKAGRLNRSADMFVYCHRTVDRTFCYPRGTGT